MKRLQKRMLAILLSLLMVLSIIPVTVLSAAADDASTATFKVYAVELNTLYRGEPVVLSSVAQTMDSGKKLSSILPEVEEYRTSAINDANMTNPFLIFALEGDGELVGDYTLPAYTSILVPNDAQDTYYSLTPGDLTMNEMKTKLGITAKPSDENYMNIVMGNLIAQTTSFKTLTVSGKLTFNALSQMSVAGYYYAGDVRDSSMYNAGMPSNAILGPFGKVVLNEGAKMDFTSSGIDDADIAALDLPDDGDDENPTDYMNKGSYLFSWGFVSGVGEVNIEDGAYVYEDFQLSDFPDMETAMSMMTRDSEQQLNGVFPVSQYYVQNIESSLNIYKGGVENIHACLSLGSNKVPIEVPFVGKPKVLDTDTQAMFVVSSGYVTKYFDADIFKTKFIINGEAAIANLQMNLYHAISIDSTDFQLPISNIDIEVTNGSTLTATQDIQLLPYASIQVDDGATLDVRSAIYVVDAAEEGERAYPGVRDVMLVSTSQGIEIDTQTGSFKNTKQISDEEGAQLVVNGTVIIRDTGDPDSPAGIAYVGDEAISGDGTIINYSTVEVPAMNVMSSDGTATSEDAELEAVRDETGEIIANNANTPVSEATAYKYSDEYDVWYVDGQKITIIFKVNADIGDFNNEIAPEKIYETKVVDFGSSVTFPEPTKYDDYRYTDYTLTGWTSSNPTADKNPNVAIANTTYTAQFEGTPAKCAVYFFSGDSDEDFEHPLAETFAYYGSHPVYTGAEPDGGNTKDFIGWSYTTYYCDGDDDVSEPGDEIITTAGLEDFIVKGATDFCAVFSNKSFKVDWLDHSGNSANPTDSKIPYGEQTHYGDQNIKDNIDYSDGYYDYAVSGWSCTYTDVNTGEVETVVISRNDYLTVKGNTTCTPIFTATPKDGADPFIQKSLTLNGAIGANVKVLLPAGYSAAECKVDFSWSNGKTYTDDSLTADGNDAAVATVLIAPKEMMDTITATLKKGDQVIASTTYHVADYAIDVINNREYTINGETKTVKQLLGYNDSKFTALQDLCRSILWYGRKAQEQFNYTPADTALVAEIDELLTGYAPAEPSALEPITYTADQFPAGISYYGSSMFLESETVYQLWFSCTPGQNPPKAYLVDGDKETELQYDADILARYNGRYTYYRINDIPAKEITDDLEIRFEGGDTVTFNAATYIAKAYADNDDPTTKTTVTALYDYNQKAIAFFG